MVPNRFEFAGAKQLLRLLDAVMAIGSEQSLADALRRITEVGAELVDARYAALGVLDESGSRLGCWRGWAGRLTGANSPHSRGRFARDGLSVQRYW